MIRFSLIAVIALFLSISQGIAEEPKEIIVHDNLMDHGNGHLMDMDGGMVMGQNTEALPGGCDRISEEREITVRAGHKYSKKFPGTIYAFDQQEWKFKPCTKLTVHFINEDNIRHQFMMHGLPKYIYKAGMFHLEVTGPGKISGTLILPGYDQTYLVHCDIAQHMEKGMKAQVVVGKGGISMPSVPGLTPQIIPDSYDDPKLKTDAPPPSPPGLPTAIPTGAGGSLLSGMLIIGLAFGLLIGPLLAKSFKGMSPAEIVNKLSAMAKDMGNRLIEIATSLSKRASSSLSQNEVIGRYKKGIIEFINQYKKSSAS